MIINQPAKTKMTKKKKRNKNQWVPSPSGQPSSVPILRVRVPAELREPWAPVPWRANHLGFRGPSRPCSCAFLRASSLPWPFFSGAPSPSWWSCTSSSMALSCSYSLHKINPNPNYIYKTFTHILQIIHHWNSNWIGSLLLFFTILEY